MEAGASSTGPKRSENNSDDFYPKIGSWICVDPDKSDEKWEVLDSDIVETDSASGPGNRKLKVRGHIIRRFNKDGDDDERVAFILKKNSWHYVEPPSDADLAEAQIARDNNTSCLECNHCKSISKKIARGKIGQRTKMIVRK